MASERKLTVVLAGDSKGLESALSSAGTESDKFGTKMGGLGTKAKLALVGAGAAVLDFAKESISAYTDAEASQETLQAAFSKFPQLAGQNTKALQDLNEQLQAKTIFDHNAAASSEAVLAQFGLTNTQMQQAIPLIEDYAARTGKSLPDAATIFGKAMLGQGKALKGVGINFKDTKSEAGNFDEVMQGLATHVGGFAEKEGKTTAGQLKILGNQFKDLQVNVGQLLLPALLKLATVGLGIVKFFKDLPGPVKDFLVIVAGLAVAIVGINKGMALWKSTTEAWTAVQKIATAVQEEFNLSMLANPVVLVVAAIVALGAALVLAYEKVGWFHAAVDATFSFVKQIVGDVVGFVTEHWQLLLAILTGPFGLATLFIKDHFDQIVGFVTSIPGRIVGVLSTLWDGLTGGITTAAQWVGDRISDVAGFVTGLPGRIASAASSVFDTLKSAATTARDWLHDRIWDVIGFVQDLPAKISAVGSTMWDGMKSGLSTVVDWIQSALTNMVNFIIRIINDAIQAYNDIPLAPNVSKISPISTAKPAPAHSSPAGYVAHKFAVGGFVKARPGGIFANIGEGRYDEAVVPMSRQGLAPFVSAIKAASGGGGNAGMVTTAQMAAAHAAQGLAELHIHMDNAVISDEQSFVNFANKLRKVLSDHALRNGPATAAFGI